MVALELHNIKGFCSERKIRVEEQSLYLPCVPIKYPRYMLFTSIHFLLFIMVCRLQLLRLLEVKRPWISSDIQQSWALM